jgi:hypothetical protein
MTIVPTDWRFIGGIGEVGIIPALFEAVVVLHIHPPRLLMVRLQGE